MIDRSTPSVSPDTASAARRVRLLLMDCDGVMTDGRLYFTAEGEAMKVFHVRDGQGIASWHAAGFESGIISGRGSAEILEQRARELGMKYVRTLSRDKAADLDEILRSSGVSSDEVAYIGDDLGDIPILSKVGFPVAVCDASSEVLSVANFVTRTPGGYGAVREVTDLLLSLKGL